MQTKPKDQPYCGVNKEKVLSAKPAINTVNMVHLINFIRERYRVHLRKDVKGLPAPWTSNPVISKYRFTNVRREHDRQTKYLIQYISTNPDLSLEDKIVNSFLFRAWNNWDTMKVFGGPWISQEVYSPKLKEKTRRIYKSISKREPDRHWWSAAYNQGGTKQAWRYPDTVGVNKEKDIPLRVFHIGPWLKEGNVVQNLLEAADQKEAFGVIRSVRGFADFLAYQVFVDLTYIKEFPFSENEFVVAGPGCCKGLDYIFASKDGMTYEEALFWLRDHINDIFTTLSPSWHPELVFWDLPEHDRNLNVMSLENCMCELSKYIRTIEGTGRPRVKYKAKGE